MFLLKMGLPFNVGSESPFVRALGEFLRAWREAEPELESLLVRMVGDEILITPQYRSKEVERDILRQLEGLGYL